VEKGQNFNRLWEKNSLKKKQMCTIKMKRMGRIKVKWMGRMNEISILKKFIWAIKWNFGFGKEKLGSRYSSYIKFKLFCDLNHTIYS